MDCHAATMPAGLVPATMLVPLETVTGRSVLFLSVRHGTPRMVVSSCTPPGIGQDDRGLVHESDELQVAQRIEQLQPPSADERSHDR